MGRVFYGHLKVSVPYARSYLLQKKIIASPTDTIYGFLGIYNLSVIKNIHQLKNRQNPFLVLISDFSQLEQFAKIESWQWNHLYSLMPGKNTVILAKQKQLPYPLGKTIAIRIPHPKDSFFLYSLLQKTKALVAPSLNETGMPPLSKSGEICYQFGKKLAGIFIDPNYQETEPSKLWMFEDKKLKQIR